MAKNLTPNKEIVLLETDVQDKIYLIRERSIMLDSDLASLYNVSTKALNQAVRRNIERFLEDFTFQLTKEEWSNLRSQIVTASWGGRRNEPFAFTEHGILIQCIK
ncbi:MAG TPA: ORF6N domain-containing protein [Pseudosphingobacterium sp.]|nr:ORF6N domain-containing protein [Pseudosphingobacterium sp.]